MKPVGSATKLTTNFRPVRHSVRMTVILSTAAWVTPVPEQ